MKFVSFSVERVLIKGAYRYKVKAGRWIDGLSGIFSANGLDLTYSSRLRAYLGKALPVEADFERCFPGMAIRVEYVGDTADQLEMNTEVVADKKLEFLSEAHREIILRVEEQLMVKRYSWRTIKTYKSHLIGFLLAHPAISLGEVTNEVIRRYIVDRGRSGQYGESTQNQLLNAIKFWLEKVEYQDRVFIDLRPKRQKKLPTVLSVEEVRRLFAVVKNLKHRCILKIIYGGGLRLSEVVNLRLADVHRDRLQIFVHCGKGKKDRYTTLSKSFLVELDKYQAAYQPDYWLFEGQTGGQYSVRSVQA
ncbi:MAG: tyrosine-type recombinase/integrase, partial [Bacteroidota bacterium]